MILVRRQAKKKLQSLPHPERYRIAEKIEQLGVNPDSTQLDVKRLANTSLFRLRVGSWRIIYERNDEIRVISIEKVKSRGDVYK